MLKYLIFIIMLLGCSPSFFNPPNFHPTNQDPKITAINNWDDYLDDLKIETLKLTCDQKMQSFYNKEINRQSKYLTPKQMEKSMLNMQEDINCE